MRLILTTLVAALLVAGCTTDTPTATDPGDDPPTATATDTGLDPADDGDDADATPPTPPPVDDEEEEPAPPTPTVTPTPPPPPPPTPTSWDLTETLQLGWAAAAGGVPEQSAQGVRNEDFCPEGVFVVPEGALTLIVSARGGPVSPDGGAGAYAIDIVGPDGTVVATLSPATSQVPEQSGQQGASDTTVEAPAPGEYGLRAEPTGPAAQHNYDLTIAARGESVGEAPATLGAATACAEA